MWWPLVHLDAGVDVGDEAIRGSEGDGAKCQEDDVSSQQRPANKLHRLQQPRHVGLVHVVEHAVRQHEQTRRPEV